MGSTTFVSMAQLPLWYYIGCVYRYRNQEYGAAVPVLDVPVRDNYCTRLASVKLRYRYRLYRYTRPIVGYSRIYWSPLGYYT